MKKFSVILLVAVLALSCVFADPVGITASISGDATATYEVNFDKKSYGYTAPGASGLKTTISMDAVTKTTAGTDLWGEMAAKITFTYAEGAKPAAALTKFAINKGDVWSLDLTKAVTVTDLAKSNLYYDAVNKKYTEDLVYSAVTNGATFNWLAKGYTFAAAVNGDLPKGGTDVYYIAAETPKFDKIANGKMYMDGAAAVKYDATAKWSVGASYNFGVVADNIKVDAATDQFLTFGKGLKLDYNPEVAINAVFGKAFATLDMYYAKKSTTGVKNLLSAGVEFDLNEFKAPVTVYFEGLNLLTKGDQELNAEASIVLAELHTLTAYGNDLLGEKELGVDAELVFTPVTIDLGACYTIGAKTIGFNAGATYVNTWFTAAAKVVAEFGKGVGATKLAPEVSVTSDKVIANTTLTAKYTANYFGATKTNGTLTTTCKIAF